MPGLKAGGRAEIERAGRFVFVEVRNMVATAERLYTVEEFWTLPEEMTDGCELIDGRLVKKHVWDGEGKGMTPPMYNHARIVGRVDRRIGAFADQRSLGEVLHGTGYHGWRQSGTDAEARLGSVRRRTACCRRGNLLLGSRLCH